MLLPFFSTIGVVIAYTALYVVAFFLCAFIRVEQPGFSHKEANRPRGRLNSRRCCGWHALHASLNEVNE
ncbi:ribitol/Xylitol/Arabitol transporter [Klebsiella pneumoniae]|uniref:Ribitol/Xylitol/Arabitol transporter n=1 Tax=Klebsiella pneumoniae TaxID=573 RepID=A0A378FYH4_KLEPN|nr:ribitol/Xylitol/Arabitol transporter [Klebsiella pneumoniae]